MKRSLSEIILAATIICLISSFAPATTFDTFRCPNGSIIQVKHKLATVMMKCDPPTSATKRSETRAPTGYLYAGYYETVEIEEWVYNLGPTSFVMYLTFENGVLRKIESGEYGY